MELFNEMISRDHEQVVFCQDKSTGLKAIIAIHNTVLGPALGGTRMWNFKTEEDALRDVLRLSRGMSYKAAAAGLNLGGGKAVIVGDPKKIKSELLFRSFGRFVESLNGRYITAEDVGTSVKDMEAVRMETPWVTGLPKVHGGSGDPSPKTALGVYHGIRACVKEKFNTTSLSGLKVAVQGTGHVGYYLIEHLFKDGVKVYVTDIDEERVNEVVDKFGCESVKADDIYGVDAEIFAPCALGAICNPETIDRFKFKIIAGSANNQLLDEQRDGKKLAEKEILYAPDYVINSGGLINVYNELLGYNEEKADAQVENIYNILLNIFSTAKEENILTYAASNRLAERRIEQVMTLKRTYLGTKSSRFAVQREK